LPPQPFNHGLLGAECLRPAARKRRAPFEIGLNQRVERVLRTGPGPDMRECDLHGKEHNSTATARAAGTALEIPKNRNFLLVYGRLKSSSTLSHIDKSAAAQRGAGSATSPRPKQLPIRYLDRSDSLLVLATSSADPGTSMRTWAWPRSSQLPRRESI
jgi:hypothetical protein